MDRLTTKTAGALLLVSAALVVLARIIYPNADGTHRVSTLHVVCIISFPIICTIWAVVRLRSAIARVSSRFDTTGRLELKEGSTWLRLSRSAAAPFVSFVLAVLSYSGYVVGCYAVALIIAMGVMFRYANGRDPKQAFYVLVVAAAVALISYPVASQVLPRLKSRRYRLRGPRNRAGE